MLDSNWETLNGSVAHQIELANAANQANVLTCVIQFFLTHNIVPQSSPPPPDEAALLMLHNAGTLLLLADPGKYRNTDVQVRNRIGVVSLVPKQWQFVDGEMKRFFRHLHSLWQAGDALDVSAFALWGINYIHPFRNGNGRTARAFSYACLSVKLGAEPPGTPNIVGLMQTEPYKSEYEDLLAETDASFLNGSLNLALIKTYILKLLNIQVQSAAVNQGMVNPSEPEPISSI